jgi:predicted dienelactone hydrolase
MRKLSIIIVVVIIGLLVSAFNIHDNADPYSQVAFEDDGLIHLKKPTGPYEIGTISFVWIDSAREEISTPSKDDLRQLFIQIWYPSDHKKNGIFASYLGSNEPVEKFQDLIGSDWFERIQKVTTNSMLNAPLSDQEENYPVVIFSPGFGASKNFYSMLLEELASHGFIVVAIDHPYLNPVINEKGHAIDPTNNYWHSFPAAGAAISLEDGLKRLQIANDYFSADHIFVLEKLKELNRTDERFKERFDLSKIASVGHSAGTMAPMGLMSKSASPFNAFIVYDVNIHNYIGGEDIIIPNTIETKVPVYLLILEYASIPPEEYVSQMKGDLHITRIASGSHMGILDFNFIHSHEEANTQSLEKIKSDLDNMFGLTTEFLKISLKY